MKKSLTLLLVVLLVGCGSSKKKTTPAKTDPPPKKEKKPAIDPKLEQAFWKELANIPITDLKTIGADAWPAVFLMERKDLANYSLTRRIELARIFWTKRGMGIVTKRGATAQQKATGTSVVVAASLLSEYWLDITDPKTHTDGHRGFEASEDKRRKDLRKYIPRHIFVESWNALRIYAKQQGWPPPGELTL